MSEPNYFPDKFSKKHHYLPVFFLKGFCNSNEKFHVYDKRRDQVLKDQTPNSKFYENNLNNFIKDGEIKFTMEESFFTPMDGDYSNLLNKIRNNPIGQEDNLTAVERFEVLQFIMQMYFRPSRSNEIYKQLIINEGLSNENMYLYNSKTGEVYSDDHPDVSEIKNELLNDEESLKIFKHIVPFLNDSLKERYEQFDKWKLYHIVIDKPTLICGDNPILVKNDELRFDKIMNEVIFPVSKRHLIILSDKSPSFIDAVFMTNINLSILHQSERFICHDDEEYLMELRGYYENLKAQNLSFDQVEATFEYMYYQSNFKTHAEYYQDYMSKASKYR